ncbi:MAG: hypothetical protein RL042_2149 [Nitrospirota bacterium]|jgi:hypothetical protein
MPGGGLEIVGLSLRLPMGLNAYLAEYEQGRRRWTLMNLTTFASSPRVPSTLVTPG